MWAGTGDVRNGVSRRDHEHLTRLRLLNTQQAGELPLSRAAQSKIVGAEFQIPGGVPVIPTNLLASTKMSDY